MRHPRPIRGLQIAVTAAFLIPCFLLVALWVRSHTWLDRIDWPIGQFSQGRTATTVSMRGLILVGVQPLRARQAGGWRMTSGRLESSRLAHVDRRRFGFKIIRRTNESGWQLPIWAAVAAMGLSAALPWIKSLRHFSLRALLVVMTLLATGLGAVAVLGR